MLARMESAAPSASATERLEEVSDTERAVYGDVSLLEMRTFLDAWARDRLGSATADVRFRAGRIALIDHGFCGYATIALVPLGAASDDSPVSAAR
jgi:hypothetical protein